MGAFLYPRTLNPKSTKRSMTGRWEDALRLLQARDALLTETVFLAAPRRKHCAEARKERKAESAHKP